MIATQQYTRTESELKPTFISDLHGANGLIQAAQGLCIYNIVKGKQKKMKQKPTTRKYGIS